MKTTQTLLGAVMAAMIVAGANAQSVPSPRPSASSTS
jgi:hypothetical protein